MSIPILQRQNNNLSASCLLFSLLVVTYLIYQPGLSGDFLFDDYSNLAALGAHGTIDNLQALQLYLNSGIAGPGGRPISLLSFLINDNSWPSTADTFKYTNLLLHLLNGILVFVLSRQILYLTVRQKNINIELIALLSTAFWLLNPYLVSTTLFVVQRMSQLSCLFVLSGLICYLFGRSKLSNSPSAGYLWMTLAIALFTPLATLSKENGILLPGFIACLEVILLSKPETGLQAVRRSWLAVFVGLPILCIFVYIGIKWPSLMLRYESRDFTLLERLLTECRIIIEYLYRLFVPHFHTSGLFHDSYQVSKSLWNPPSTLLALIACILLLLLCILPGARHRHLKLASAFFLIGHSLESTVIPLELYFEHRNYLPSVFLLLPFCVMAIAGQGKRRPLFILLICIYITSLGFASWQRASLWGKPEQLYLTWANANPDSRRAQRAAAIALTEIARPDMALSVLQRARSRIPNDLYLQLHYLSLKCVYGQAEPALIQETKDIAAQTHYSHFSYPLLESFSDRVMSGRCSGVSHEDALAILKQLRIRPIQQKQAYGYQQLYQLIGLLLLDQGKLQDAMREFNLAIKENPRAAVYMTQIATLASYGYFTEALVLGQQAAELIDDQALQISATERSYYQRELKTLLETIKQDAQR